jgi:hypothetical protein
MKRCPDTVLFTSRGARPSAQRFRLTYLPQVHLGGLQNLMPEDHLRGNLKENFVPAGIGCRVGTSDVGSDLHVHTLPESFDEGSRGGIGDREDMPVGVKISGSQVRPGLPSGEQAQVVTYTRRVPIARGPPISLILSLLTLLQSAAFRIVQQRDRRNTVVHFGR